MMDDGRRKKKNAPKFVRLQILTYLCSGKNKD